MNIFVEPFDVLTLRTLEKKRTFWGWFAQCAKRTLLSTGGGARTSIENCPAEHKVTTSVQSETPVLQLLLKVLEVNGLTAK